MPTSRQLKKGAHHADYEIGMLIDSEAALLELPSSRAASLLQRALLESWAVHLRNLIEFFYPKSNPDPDTVLAQWYVDDPARWRRALPSLTKRERLRRKALHKHLAHISFLRDARKTRWSPRDHQIVRKRLVLFRAHLHRRYRHVFSALARL